MKLIESKAEYIPQEEGLEGIYKAIEIAGRTAYKSEDKITHDSAKGFVDKMIKSKHGAALEAGTVYLNMPYDTSYEENPYSKSSWDGHNIFVSTNYRVIIENNWLDDLQYLCSPTEFHEKRYTMRFTCSRAIAQELTRHRKFSFLMESQRYINYSKKRHGGEITFIEPSWKEEKCPGYFKLRRLCEELEKEYMELIEWGCTPQQARDILPNATKTELIMTGFASDWRFLMDLRLFEKTGKVHPDMLDLMQKALGAMQVAGIWKDIMSKPSKFELYDSKNNLQK